MKFIGVYPTRRGAKDAIARHRSAPGFCNWPDAFEIHECELGEDHWTDGFSTMVGILIPNRGARGSNCGAMAAWHPGDLYEICTIDEQDADAETMFQVGDVVVCNDIDGELVASELADRNSSADEDSGD